MDDAFGGDTDPVGLFERWLREARDLPSLTADVMTLATATTGAMPSVRSVLLRGFDHRGFVFYTNHGSRKGREIAANPQAAVSFFWPELSRQVLVGGSVEPVSRVESERYWATRPRENRLAAWASEQSRPVESYAALERRYDEVAERFAGTEPPLPSFWGGFRIHPASIEFWRGSLHRLHERIRYDRDGAGWSMTWLAP